MLSEYHIQFRAMGTDVSVLAVGRPGSSAVPSLLNRVQGLFMREEARFSRFRPDSELSRLNQIRVLRNPSSHLWDVLQRSRQWWEATDGDFDPTVLDALEQAGYTTTFDAIAVGGSDAFGFGQRKPALGFTKVVVEESGKSRCVRLLDGVRLDLGGIVKGWTVDRAAELLSPLGRYLIDAGGDIYAGGDSLESEGWCVAVEDPLRPTEDQGYLLLRDMALATSGTYRRRWRRADGNEVHHLIDPRLGTPSDSDVVSATVLGNSVESSEVYAKVALLRGVQDGLRFLEEAEGIEGLLFDRRGATSTTSGWRWHLSLLAR